MASKRWYKIVSLIGLVLILAAGVAVVSAHVGGVSPGVIHTCVNTASGEIKVVGDSAVCKNGQSALDWNAIGPIGPAGPTGAAGAPGADGAPGAAGPSGISAYEVVSAESANNSTDKKTQTAVCSSGKKVLGGGGEVTGGGANTFVLIESRPTNSAPGTNNAWQVVIGEDVATSDSWKAKAYAVCATVSS